MTDRVRVLFMQSQEFFGADSQIHASIMTHLDRDRFEVHCAPPRPRNNVDSAAVQRVRRIDDVALRLTEFGPSLEAEHSAVAGSMRAARASGSLLGLARYIRRHGIEIVHCTEKPRDTILGRVVAKLGGADCVVHAHVAVQSWMRPGVLRAMRHAKALIGVSEFIAQSIVDAGYPSSRVHAVLNGLELSEWLDVPVDPAPVRREFGITVGTPLLVSASRLYRYKGQHEILAALPSVKQEFPNVKLLIVGEDDPGSYTPEASYTATLKQMCVDLDLSDNVVFTGFRTDVRSLMAACDLYVMPSFEEPFGMVFVEAMSLERPVVALNNGGTREVVDHGGSGLLSEPGDTPALAENIRTLLRDPELRRRMGTHGRERVKTHFNSCRMARDVEQVYEAVITERRRRKP
jgi:glycosyltransferase involved in cell wall biosynthesis